MATNTNLTASPYWPRIANDTTSSTANDLREITIPAQARSIDIRFSGSAGYIVFNDSVNSVGDEVSIGSNKKFTIGPDQIVNIVLTNNNTGRTKNHNIYVGSAVASVGVEIIAYGPMDETFKSSNQV